jgi:hypothetical protein
MVITPPRERSPQPPASEAPESARQQWLIISRRVLGIASAFFVLVSGGSYGAALIYPGQASFSVRSVEWLRDHGGSPLVDAVENWWYTRQAPSTKAPVPHLNLTPATGPGTPPSLPLIGKQAAVGEGQWVAGPTSTRGVPAMFSSIVRPDPDHPGVLAGIARFDQNLITAHLIAGTREPDQSIWSQGGQVPAEQRPSLVATFNSGFKMSGAAGGYYADGKLVGHLRDGAASLVITRDGRISVDQWGRDRQFGPDIAAVRQNLSLIIDHGVPVPGLEVNRDDRWGSAKNQLQYTWRSALGVDAAGTLYYVAGDKLTLATLTRALLDTGAVRGMELDIHPAEVHLFAYRHLTDGAPRPRKLLGTMRGPRDRYLQPDQRDFIALTLR